MFARTVQDDAVIAESQFTVGNGSTAQTTASASNASIAVSGKIVPSGNIAQGKPYIIGGILSSTSNITQVYGGVYSADGKTSVLYCTDNPNSTSYDLRRKFDNSLTFNTQWATEDNERFSSAQTMLNKLRSSLASIKRSYRESCPIVRKQQPQGEMFRDRLKPSVFERSVLTNGGCARDLFGIESFNDNIQTLYVEQRALFANVLASLMLCYKELEKEKQTKADPDKCAELLEKQCRDIMKELKDTIEMIQSPVNDEIQQFIDQMGLREFAQQGYHKYSIAAVKRHAISVYKQGYKSNFEQVASMTWTKNPEKGNDAEILIDHFDEFRPENRKKVSSKKILLFVNWCGNTIEAPQQRFYNILKAYYHTKELPEWHAVTVIKNQMKNLKEEQEKFNEEVEIFLKTLKEAA